MCCMAKGSSWQDCIVLDGESHAVIETFVASDQQQAVNWQILFMYRRIKLTLPAAYEQYKTDYSTAETKWCKVSCTQHDARLFILSVGQYTAHFRWPLWGFTTLRCNWKSVHQFFFKFYSAWFLKLLGQTERPQTTCRPRDFNYVKCKFV